MDDPEAFGSLGPSVKKHFPRVKKDGKKTPPFSGYVEKNLLQALFVVSGMYGEYGWECWDRREGP